MTGRAMWYTIVVCGGTGSRMGAGINKVLLTLNGKTVLQRSLEPFSGLTDGLVIAARPDETDVIRGIAEKALPSLPVRIVPGGATRQESVFNALRAVPEEADFVMIHDGARCMVTENLIVRVREKTEADGSAVPALRVTDSVKQADHPRGLILKTVDRDALIAVQTPQAFRRAEILEAHQKASEGRFMGTDDASLMEFAGLKVYTVEGDRLNMKMTSGEDMVMASALLNARSELRVGHGYDVHRLVAGRDLILCGIRIPWQMGLLGHSDADVAVHALMDAMLGAAACGDIGKHFPDKDPAYEGISSLILLKKVVEILDGLGARTENADITIVAQQPKLAPFIEAMRESIAGALGIPVDRVSVKATTTEGLGFEGEGKGISAQAVCTLRVG